MTEGLLVSAVQTGRKSNATKICPETSSGLLCLVRPRNSEKDVFGLLMAQDVTDDFERGSKIALSAVTSST